MTASHSSIGLLTGEVVQQVFMVQRPSGVRTLDERLELGRESAAPAGARHGPAAARTAGAAHPIADLTRPARVARRLDYLATRAAAATVRPVGAPCFAGPPSLAGPGPASCSIRTPEAAALFRIWSHDSTMVFIDSTS